MLIDAKTALKQLAEDVKKEILRRMEQYGMNPRAGRNTLVGSDLEKSVSVEPTDKDTIVFQIADYFEYVVRGWKRTGNYPGTMRLFIDNITKWVRKNGIAFEGRTENQTVWAIVKSIWMRGPAIIIPFLDDYFDKWSDLVWNQIIEELDKFFTD